MGKHKIRRERWLNWTKSLQDHPIDGPRRIGCLMSLVSWIVACLFCVKCRESRNKYWKWKEEQQENYDREWIEKSEEEDWKREEEWIEKNMNPLSNYTIITKKCQSDSKKDM